jgi:hypothetical protein
VRSSRRTCQPAAPPSTASKHRGNRSGGERGATSAVEGCLPALRDGDRAVGAAGLEKQTKSRRGAVEVETQMSDGRDQGLSGVLDGDASDLIVLKHAGRAQHCGEVGGIRDC